MEPRDFCYWLQGFFEVSGATQTDEKQTEMIKNHLSLVFAHSIDTPDPTGKLQDIHDGVKPTKTVLSRPPGIRC